MLLKLVDFVTGFSIVLFIYIFGWEWSSKLVITHQSYVISVSKADTTVSLLLSKHVLHNTCDTHCGDDC